MKLAPIAALSTLWFSAACPAQCPGYVLDDGSGGFTIGPSNFDAMVTWGNYFEPSDGCTWLTEVEVSFAGSLPEGTPITVLVYADPDGDGDPTNAVLRSAASHESQATSTSEFATYAIRPTPVDAAGFFVGIAAFAPQRQSVARMDQDTLGTTAGYFTMAGFSPSLAPPRSSCACPTDRFPELGWCGRTPRPRVVQLTSMEMVKQRSLTSCSSRTPSMLAT